MKHTTRSSRFLIGVWVLAGLVVAGVNGYSLGALQDTPLTGFSDGIRTLDRGLRQVQSWSALEFGPSIHEMERLAGKFTPPSPPDPSPKSAQRTVDQSRLATVQVTETPVSLPVLEGILTGFLTNGDTKRLALLNGRICSEGEQVGDLIVETISTFGVRLKNGESSWFVSAPDNPYSLIVN